ncbi:hypothetical protein ACSBOB_01580 [Mesorhizobium sp. ASY16-5R]
MTVWRSIGVSAVPLVIFVLAAVLVIYATCDGEFGACLDAIAERP